MSRGEALVFGAILVGVAVAIGWFTHPVLTMSLAVILMALVGYVALWRHRNAGSVTLVNRWTSRSKKHQGVASFWTILRVSSGRAMRRKATILRPHMTGLSRWARWRTPITEYATPIMRAGWLRVHASCEDVTLGFGGPRVGKTGELCVRILDAPGAVLATSTRTDLIDHTLRNRATKGPVYVFNPSKVGNLPSTITFSPLSGCEDHVVATARAQDLLSATGRITGENADHWMNLSRQTLALLLHAAALGGSTMRDVRSWVADPEQAATSVMRLLGRSQYHVFDDARQLFTMSERTRSSICATIMPSLSWLNDPRAAEVAERGDFNVAKFLADKGTVYLLGAEDAHVAPLVTAFTGHVARESRRIAGLQPKGRLNPPLTMALDEAALICPIPLDKWTADMGGRNITMHIRVQSRAQLRDRWGDRGAATIINNAATLIIFGGTRDSGDLREYSSLVPALTPDQFAQLPARHAVIVSRGMPPVVGKPLMVWQRHRRQRRRQFMLVPVTALTSALARYRLRRRTQHTVVRKPIAALPVGHTDAANWTRGVTSATNRERHD